MPSPTVAELQEELDRMRNIIGQYRQLEIATADLLLISNTLVNTLQLRIEEMEREKLLHSPLSTPIKLQQEFVRMDTIQFRQKEMEMAALMTLHTNLQMRYEELRRNTLRSTFNTPFSTLPAQNLQPAMMSVAQLDGRWHTTLDNLIALFETRKKRLLTQHQQTTPEPSAPTPFGATVSSGLPGTLQSQPNPILTVSGRALSNAKGTPNDYDKPVEVEQCKLCEPAWKLVFGVCATNAYRRQNIRILYQRKILTTTHLFSLKLAVITPAIPKETPRTMESLQHTYLPGFGASISTSRKIAFRNNNQDVLYKTLIQALYDG